PRQARCHLRIAVDHDAFQIVLSAPREKGRYFESFGLPCQRASEDFLSGNRNLRCQHEIPRRRKVERRELLTDALAERAASEEKERHVRAQFRADFLKSRALKPQVP